MKKKGKPRSPGEIRQSQIVTTFGPGAMVDLPKHSVLIGGLDFWKGDRKPIHEKRLEQYICQCLELEAIKMQAPPVDVQAPDAPATGIEAFIFPAWFVAQIRDEDLKTMTSMGWFEEQPGYRSRPLIHWQQLVRGQYLTPDRKQRPVVPVRFVQACPRGHLSDINWKSLAHSRGTKQCKHEGMLWLDESGSGGDLTAIYVRCQGCGERRALSDAKTPDHKGLLGACGGERPWLGSQAREQCLNPFTGKPEYNRLLVRSASYAYFSQNLSVISIPDANNELIKAVSTVYEDFLLYVDSMEDLIRERKKQKVANALEGYSNERVLEEILSRKSNTPKPEKTIKQAEIETLLSCQDSAEADFPEGDFYARNRVLHNIPSSLQHSLRSVVLVHRLREVVAQVGFTRFEAALPNIEGELDLNVTRAALAQDLSWVPAIENRGEGVFLAFQNDAIHQWLEKQAVQQRGQQLRKGFQVWTETKGMVGMNFPGLPYTMLHSLAHLLITAVSLECGYAATAIRERVYAGDYGYGILLYTGTSGSEGTLGGLVQVGHRIEHHLDTALDMGRLCSNDPVCAQHTPDNVHEEWFLHGAACHGCLLIAESSCERHNTFLDRALVVETVDRLGAAFF